MESSQPKTYPKPLDLFVTQIFLITVALSNYGNRKLDLPSAEQDAQTMHDHFSKMGVPEDKISHLVNPDKADFFAVIKKVKESLQNGNCSKTQLFLHFSGHGMGNGGYIANFGDEDYVNLSAECSALSKKFSNLWILLIFDACTVAQPQVGSRLDLIGAAPVGAFKTVTLSACRLGQIAYSQWKFTKSFAEFMTQKVISNKGLFKIPEDVFDFEGPNGEHELLMALTKKTFITLQFPIAGKLPKPSPVKQPVPKKYVVTYTHNVAEKPHEQDQEYPVKAKLNWFNPLNGVSKSDYYCSFQFISLDGTKSAFEDSKCSGPDELTDYIIPQGKQIRTVETMLDKDDGRVFGFKWIGDDGAVLLAVGVIDYPKARDNPRLVLQSFTLNHNQTLVGVKSASGGYQEARHYSFQWVICTEK